MTTLHFNKEGLGIMGYLYCRKTQNGPVLDNHITRCNVKSPKKEFWPLFLFSSYQISENSHNQSLYVYL